MDSEAFREKLRRLDNDVDRLAMIREDVRFSIVEMLLYVVLMNAPFVLMRYCNRGMVIFAVWAGWSLVFAAMGAWLMRQEMCNRSRAPGAALIASG